MADAGLAVCFHQPGEKSVSGTIVQEELLLLGVHPGGSEPGAAGGHLDMDPGPAERDGPTEQNLGHTHLCHVGH